MRSSTTIQRGQAKQAAPELKRIVGLDGLRGVAAVTVVIFHYLYLLHPDWVTDSGSIPHWLVDTPLSIVWNGRFAVMVFFVLSGFVMSAAAARRHDEIITNFAIRYLRLAVPVVASVFLALFWLSLFPTATTDLAEFLEQPSRWLNFTVQEPLPSLAETLVDGVIANFVRGYSPINNVLWTMQIELVGSFVLFVIYWLGANNTRIRYAALATFAVVGVFVLRDAYLCFVTGALLYEAHRSGLVRRIPVPVAIIALVLGIILGAPGPGFADRMGLDWLRGRLQPGNADGLIPVTAATLILFAFLRITTLERAFAATLPRWLGRISFGLYLVHVPLLYTLVAWERVNLGLPEPMIVLGYTMLTFGLAYLFTRLVDEPSLRQISRLRPAVLRMDSMLKTTVARARRA